jgi:dolichol-phosphate mannosyltransferase
LREALGLLNIDLRMSQAQLFAFAPVYNEAGSIRQVAQEWVDAFRRLGIRATLLLLDDGSSDATPAILEELRRELPELQVVRHSNRGHGPSCTQGYRRALESGAEWIFQIDSDGQCDPAYFPKVWAARESRDAVFGYRTRRDDGLSRLAISRILSSLVFTLTGLWIKDSNVPYRLFRRPLLERLLPKIPDTARFPNVLLSIAVMRDTPPVWIPIRFRNRSAGESTVNLGKMAHFARQVYGEVRSYAAFGSSSVGGGPAGLEGRPPSRSD